MLPDNPYSFRIYRNNSTIWTEDLDAGLPGAPQVVDFIKPTPRKKIPQSLTQQNPSFLVVLFSTLAIILTSLINWSLPFHQFSASQEAIFTHGQYQNLFLSMLSHGDTAHLLSNLIGFIGFGYLLKRHFGILAFPIVPALLGILTTLLTVLSMPENHSVLGSSGIVFAQVGLYVTLYFIFEKRYSLISKLVRVSGFLLVLFFPHEYSATTSYLSHGIGFALGVLAGPLIAPYLGNKGTIHPKSSGTNASENPQPTLRYRKFKLLKRAQPNYSQALALL